jgi:kynurenine formamidase
MHVIDLSHTIHDDIQIYPGDPVPAIRRGLTHEENYCHVDTLQLGSHTGTHIDAPYHFLKEGDTIDRIPVERFVGYGVLIDVSAKADNEMIAPDDVEPYSGQIRKGNFAIFRTGWDRYFGTPRYFQHPFLSADGARLLLNLGVSVVAIDAMSVDPSSFDAVIGDPATKDKDRKQGTGYPAHEVLLGNDIPIVENLCGLERVKAVKGMYCFLPLKLKGSDGSPIRAVFVMS